MLSTARPTPDAWRLCYAQLAPKLLLFARQWFSSSADAEDVVQVAFIRFWQRQPDAQPQHYPLLYAAVRSAALDKLRTDSRRDRREDLYGQEAEKSFFSQEDPPELAEGVQAALDELPTAQREALVLRIWGELTFAEIAETVGESINTVSARYRYALAALRKNVKPVYERP